MVCSIKSLHSGKERVGGLVFSKPKTKATQITCQMSRLIVVPLVVVLMVAFGRRSASLLILNSFQIYIVIF